MVAQYKLVNSKIDGVLVAINKIDTNTIIPVDPGNTDYQEYLEWLAEGNEPEPADEVTP